MRRNWVVLGLLLVGVGGARADDADAYLLERVRLGASLTYASFEQQVKTEVGGTSVQPLVVERAFGAHLTATAGIWRFIRLGVYLQLDVGERSAARFEGVVDDEPVVSELSGGRFWEVWMGPLLRLQWRFLAFEIGYGLIGARGDRARSDLPSSTGDTDGTLRTSPRIAWHVGLVAYAPVHPSVDIVIRVNYRVRYYDRRGGESLRDGVVHGTQNLSPTVGVAWHR